MSLCTAHFVVLQHPTDEYPTGKHRKPVSRVSSLPCYQGIDYWIIGVIPLQNMRAMGHVLEVGGVTAVS
jgi:hypothetical protein